MRMLPELSLLASPRFTPRELIRLTAASQGLDLCIGGLRQVLWKDLVAVAVVSVGRPTPEPNLFLLIRDQLRPFRVPGGGVDLAAFGIAAGDSREAGLRALLIEFDRNGEHIAIPEDTATFLRGGLVHSATEIELAALTTNWMAGLYPRLKEELAPAPIVDEDPDDEPDVAELARAVPTGTGPPEVFGPSSPVEPPLLLRPIEQQTPYGTERRNPLLADLPERLPAQPLPARRLAATWALAAGVSLLPLTYLAVVVGLLFRVYRYAAEDGLALFAVGEEGRRTLEMGDFYFLWPVGWLLLLLIAFVEPLFVGSRTVHRVTSLKRDREPVLHAIVDRIAGLVRAESPEVIQVTSDASVGTGWRKTEIGKQKVLTLGLPMVAGLSSRQLAGFVASELVVFRKRSNRRPVGWIRKIDEGLADLGSRCEELQQKRRDGVSELVQRLGLGLVIDFLLLMIFGAARVVVFFLVFLSGQVRSLVERWAVAEGRAVSRRLEGEEASRQRLAWTEQLRQAQIETILEGLSAPDVMPADHLPARGVLHALQKRAETNEDNGQQPPYRGMPATALFRDFGSLARQVTRDLFRNEAGGVAATEALEDVLRRMSGEDAEADVRCRFFADTLLSWRSLPLASDWEPDPRPDSELVSRLSQLRQGFVAGLEKHRSLVAKFDQAFALRVSALRAALLMQHGFELDPRRFGLTSWEPDAAKEQILRSTQFLREASQALQPYEARSGHRVMAALALISSPERAARLEGVGEERLVEVHEMLRSLREITAAFPSWVRAREELAVMAGFEDEAQRDPSKVSLPTLQSEVWTGRLAEPLGDLQQKLWGITDPFHVGGLDFSVVILGLPEGDWANARDIVVRVHHYFLRAMGRLAVLGEQVELAAGFDPLPQLSPREESLPVPGRYSKRALIDSW